MAIKIITAYDLNRCIGNQGKLPWHLPEDLKWFKNLTKKDPVIMGSRTWDSIGAQPLKGRRNIVLSNDWRRRGNYDICCPHLDYAISWAKHWSVTGDIWIIGGATVYQAALAQDLVDEVYATEITAVYEGDTFFPVLPVNKYTTWEVCQIASLIPNARVLHYRKAFI
jgi:dihydrofolate reductase